jgi:TolB protein
MAVVGNDGSLALVAADGRWLELAPPGDAVFGFPAWSPDGTRIAAIRYGQSSSQVLVFDAREIASTQAVRPVTLLDSTSIGPFYLSWTPDGQAVAFLANEPDGSLALRIAPADGSAPTDGSGPGSKIRSGNPFYFDWIEKDRLLAHVGSGSDAFLGEIGLDGGSVAPAIEAPGDFRSAVVNRDRSLFSYVRAGAGTGDASAVVVASRTGSSQHEMPVFGTAAVTFDPAGDAVASIGPSAPAQSSFNVPVGPLRLLDADTGHVRTLLDGTVVGFWWSPDGQTIAALRVQPIAATASGSPPPVASGQTPRPSAQATPEPRSEVRILFVDVASGHVQSQVVVQPGQLFIDQFLTYFDQYALSHHLWAPDSSSIVMPVVDTSGTHLAVLHRDGSKSATLDGAIAFWSP